jgi:lactoylglutathione lyase
MPLNLIVIRCQDIEKSKDFYSLFDIDFVEEHHGSGPKHYSTKDNDLLLELYPLGKSSEPDNIRLGFSVKDSRSCYFAIKEKGFEIERNTFERDGQKLFIALDPDGRKIEVIESQNLEE